jgi:hypothetical protein
VVISATCPKQPSLAKPHRRLPQFRLEDHNQQNGHDAHEVVNDEVQAGKPLSSKTKELQQNKGRKQDGESLDNASPACALEKSDGEVDHHPDERQLNHEFEKVDAEKAWWH